MYRPGSNTSYIPDERGSTLLSTLLLASANVSKSLILPYDVTQQPLSDQAVDKAESTGASTVLKCLTTASSCSEGFTMAFSVKGI